MKGGDFLETMVASGVGAYAAKTSGSMSSLLWKLAKYALVVIAIILAVGIVLRLLGVEQFTLPQKPSAEGDKKLVTPAGNVVMY